MYWVEHNNRPEEVITILFTFCLSLHNFVSDCVIGVVEISKESLCHGDSRDIYDHMITTRHNKMAALETQNA